MNIFSMFNTVFRGTDKGLTVVEDGIDVAKAKTTLWKAEAMDELNDALKDYDIAEVHEFYDSLYTRNKPRKKK